VILTKIEILEAFKILNSKFQIENAKAEVCLVGGAVMCLVFNAREQTKDVDAIFHPKAKMYQLAKLVAEELGLPEDWLNDSAKAYVNKKLEKIEILNLSNLKIFAPSAKYMLAMKCLASRVGTKDESDIEFLIKHLKLKKAQEVISIVSKYYDEKLIQPKTQYMIEEIIELNSKPSKR
jgi:hypothetical protein